ncbi:mechanosensitive ion channel family protein [Bdellovibrio bacteriovorus]|uniref:mechanosensitive ion channel family protein n=1 Tax=Bdellovibrio bacteriovorus TaxID=959 RepID=UPI0021CF2501|nr:mechanosensitive ion channel family protein [Bdellovibrio bacteriovorus]UXR64555.1 mechanosensitive ion channel family protein [Bdellovibrio bacteriovorus]
MNIQIDSALAWSLLKAALLLILFAILWRVITFAKRKGEETLQTYITSRLTTLKEKRLLVFDTKVINKTFMGVLSLIVFFVRLSLIYLLGTAILLAIPYTQSWSSQIIDFILTPLRWLGAGAVSVLPNLIFIMVIAAVAHYLLKALKFIFDSIKDESIHINGFHADWAEPTYQLARILVFVIFMVVCFPYIPGSDSAAFKGLSVFLGVLISLGSSSAISNVMSGLVITYMRPFRLGDRVKIADIVGDVLEKNLLVTRIRTAQNLDVTVPNAMILSNHITNFSFQADSQGVSSSVSVTIGYDVPWDQVHKTLLAAAQRTRGVLAQPAPFVLQTSLNDFNVAYELNIWTSEPKSLRQISSDLNCHIQEECAKAGIEIMSPHYISNRDGNKSTIPSF